MRLLANENVPREAVEALRRRGHDIAWVREDDPGASDEEVLARAVAEDRVLLTFDKDFGELIFGRGVQASRGVVLLRLPPSLPDLVGRIVEKLESRSDWEGNFGVVEADDVRLRPLP